jgi:glycosyltransferase involved in cell wall biosynthesis
MRAKAGGTEQLKWGERAINWFLTLWWREARQSRVMTQGRFAFCSRFLPPLWSGQAIVIGRLLSQMDRTIYCLISQPHDRGKERFQDTVAALYYDLPPERSVSLRFHPGLTARINLYLSILQRAWATAKIVRRDKTQILIACTGDMADPPATWLAARLTGCDLYFYFFDDFTLQWWADPKWVARARRFERLIVRSATGLIAPNKVMASVLFERYGRPSAIVLNPTAWDLASNPDKPAPLNTADFRVVFTGAVYHLNFDVLNAVVASFPLVEHEKPALAPKLHIYTAQEHSHLEQQGLRNDAHVVLHRHIPPSEIAKVQREADILLIPFSFTPAARDFVKSSATAKLADYLAAGRIVIAMCPTDSFLGQYIVQNQCGLVIDRDDPQAIADAIVRLIETDGLAETIMNNALYCAKRDFNPAEAQAKLMKGIGLK